MKVQRLSVTHHSHSQFSALTTEGTRLEGTDYLMPYRLFQRVSYHFTPSGLLITFYPTPVRASEQSVHTVYPSSSRFRRWTHSTARPPAALADFFDTSLPTIRSTTPRPSGSVFEILSSSSSLSVSSPAKAPEKRVVAL